MGCGASTTREQPRSLSELNNGDICRVSKDALSRPTWFASAETILRRLSSTVDNRHWQQWQSVAGAGYFPGWLSVDLTLS